jgi:RNA polymerase sigma-70 factor, ECF subfamily
MNSTDQFETLVGDYYEPLFRFAMSLTFSEADAWDLTQQTFYTWATKGHQLRDATKAKTWLFTTLHRAFLQGRRRQTRFPHDDWDEVSNQLPAFAPEAADRVDTSQVLSALARLDEAYRAAVALFYLDDCPYREIAEALGVPVGTVKSRVARGLMQLREILGFIQAEPALAPVSTTADAGCERAADAFVAEQLCECSPFTPAGSLVPSRVRLCREPNPLSIAQMGVAAFRGTTG